MSVYMFPDGNFYDTTGLDQETVKKAWDNIKAREAELNAKISQAPDPSPGLGTRIGQLLESGTREALGAGAEAIAQLDDAVLGKDVFDESGLLEFAKRQREEARQIPAIKAIQEAEGVTDVFKTGASYLVQSIPEMSPMFVAGGIGWAIGGPLGGAIGLGISAIPRLFPHAGRNVEEFKEVHKREPNQQESLSLLATGAVQSAIDSAIAFIAPSVGILKGSPALATNIIKRAFQGTLVEGFTEFSQDVLQILSANNWDVEALKTPEAKYRLTESALAGGLVGAQVGAITSPLTRERPITGNQDDIIHAQSLKEGQPKGIPSSEVPPSHQLEHKEENVNWTENIYSTPIQYETERTNEQIVNDSINDAQNAELINIWKERLESGESTAIDENDPVIIQRLENARRKAEQETTASEKSSAQTTNFFENQELRNASRLNTKELLSWAEKNQNLHSRIPEILTQITNKNQQALQVRRLLKDLMQKTSTAAGQGTAGVANDVKFKIKLDKDGNARVDEFGEPIVEVSPSVKIDADGNPVPDVIGETEPADTPIRLPDRSISEDIQALKDSAKEFLSVSKANEQRADDASIVTNADGSIDSEATKQKRSRYDIASKYFDARLADLAKRGKQGRMIAESIREQVLINPARNANNLVAAFAAADAAVEVLGKNDNVALNFLGSLEATEQQKLAHGIDPKQKTFVAGSASRTEPIINMVFEASTPAGQLVELDTDTIQRQVYHEAFHTFQNFYGKQNPKFKALLDKTFGKPQDKIDPKKYKSLPSQLRRMMSRYNNEYHKALLRGEISPDSNELQAQFFEAYKKGLQQGDPTPVGGLFGGYLNFIGRFIPRLRNMLGGYGFQSIQDLYEKAPQGKKGYRFKTPKELRTEKTKGKPPIPANSEIAEKQAEIRNKRLDVQRKFTDLSVNRNRQDQIDQGLAYINNLSDGRINKDDQPENNTMENISSEEADASILNATVKTPVVPFNMYYNVDREQKLDDVRIAKQDDLGKKYEAFVIGDPDFPSELKNSTLDEIYEYYKQRSGTLNIPVNLNSPSALSDFLLQKISNLTIDIHKDVFSQTATNAGYARRGVHTYEYLRAELLRQHFNLPLKQKDPSVLNVSFSVDGQHSIDERIDPITGIVTTEQDKSILDSRLRRGFPKPALFNMMSKIVSSVRNALDSVDGVDGISFSPFGSDQEVESKHSLYNTIVTSKQFKKMFPELGEPFTISDRFGEELVTETSDGYARHTIIPLKTREHNESSKARLERSKELIDAINNHTGNPDIVTELDASIVSHWDQSALNPMSREFNIDDEVTGKVDLSGAEEGDISTVYMVKVQSQKNPVRLVVYHSLPSVKMSSEQSMVQRIAEESRTMDALERMSDVTPEEMSALMSAFNTDDRLIRTDFTFNGMAAKQSENLVTTKEAIDILNKVISSTKFAWEYWKDRSTGLLNKGNTAKKDALYKRMFNDFQKQDGTVRPSSMRENMFPDLKKPIPYVVNGKEMAEGSVVPVKRTESLNDESEAFRDVVHKRIAQEEYAKRINSFDKSLIDRTSDDANIAMDMNIKASLRPTKIRAGQYLYQGYSIDHISRDEGGYGQWNITPPNEEFASDAADSLRDAVALVDDIKEISERGVKASPDFGANSEPVPSGKLVKNYLEPRITQITSPTENDAGIIVYNGGGGTFLKFSTSMIGKGEGNIAFGWGLYFADLTGTGLSYALDKIRYGTEEFSKSKDPNQDLIFSLRGQELLPAGRNHDSHIVYLNYEGEKLNYKPNIDIFKNRFGNQELKIIGDIVAGKDMSDPDNFRGMEVPKTEFRSEDGVDIMLQPRKDYSSIRTLINEIPDTLGDLINFLNEKKINPEKLGDGFRLKYTVNMFRVDDSLVSRHSDIYTLARYKGRVGFYKTVGQDLPNDHQKYFSNVGETIAESNFFTFEEFKNLPELKPENRKSTGDAESGVATPANVPIDVVAEYVTGDLTNKKKIEKKLLHEFYQFTNYGQDESLTEFVEESPFFEDNEYAKEEFLGSFPENKVNTLKNILDMDRPKVDMSKALEYVKKAYDEDRLGIPEGSEARSHYRDQIARMLSFDDTEYQKKKTQIDNIVKTVNDNAGGWFEFFKKEKLDDIENNIDFLKYFMFHKDMKTGSGRRIASKPLEDLATQLFETRKVLQSIDPFKDIKVEFNTETDTKVIQSSLRKADLEVDPDLQNGNLFKFEVPLSAQKLLDTLADREIFASQSIWDVIPITLERIVKPFHSGKLLTPEKKSIDGKQVDLDRYYPNKLAQYSESNLTPARDRTSEFDNEDKYSLGKQVGQMPENVWQEQYAPLLELLTKAIRKYHGDPKRNKMHAEDIAKAQEGFAPTSITVHNTLAKEFDKADDLGLYGTSDIEAIVKRKRIDEIENDFKQEYYKANNVTQSKINKLLPEVPYVGKVFTEEEARILNVESIYKQFITSPVYVHMFKKFIKEPVYEFKFRPRTGLKYSHPDNFKRNHDSARKFYEHLEAYFREYAERYGAVDKNGNPYTKEDFSNMGRAEYKQASRFTPAKKASLALKELGFAGHRYNERMSRDGKKELFGEDGDHNYVIYNDDVITMLESNGVPVANTIVDGVEEVKDVKESASILFQVSDPRFSQGMQQVMADPRRNTIRYKILNNIFPISTLHKRLGRAFINQAIFGLRPVRTREEEYAYQKAVNEGDPNPQRKMLSLGEGAFRLTELAQQTTGRVQTMATEGAYKLMPDGTPMLDPNTKGLFEIFKPIGQGAEYSKFSMYVFAKRAARLRAEGRERLLTDQQIDEGLAYGDSNPVFETVFQEYSKFNEATLQFMVDTGTISQETANQLKDTSDYVPFYRIIENEEYTEGMFGLYKKADLRKRVGTTSGFDNPDARVKEIFRKLKGGEEKIGDLYTNIFSNQQAMVGAALKNLAMQRVVLITEGNKSFGMYRGTQAPRFITKQEAENNTNHFTFRENGITKFYDAGQDGELLTALRTFEPVQMQGLFRIMQGIAKFFRNLITATPGFMIANLIRGEMAGVVTVDAPLRPFVDTAVGLKNALANSETVREMKAIGGFGGYTFGDDAGDFAKKMKRHFRAYHRGYDVVDTPTKLSDMFYNLVDRVQSLGEATELATRDGVYRANIRNGMDKGTAAHEALNVINFNRKGNPTSFAAQSLAVLLPLVPFLNARLQGLYRTGTALSGAESNPMRTALKGATLMGLSIALYGLMSQRDEWDDEPLYRKLNYYIIYVGDKKFLIPKPFEIGAIFSTLPELFLDGIRKKDGEYVAQGVQQLFLNNFSFNPIPQAILPLIEVGTNYDMFKQRDLESMGVRGLPTAQRAYSSTSEFAKVVGKASSHLGISPIEVEQLINGYLGSMGSLFLAGIDSVLAGTGAVPSRPTGIMGNSFADPIANLLGITRFYKENTGDRASRWLSEFYDLKREVDQIYRGMNQYREQGDFETAKEMRKEYKPYLLVRKRLNNMYEQLTNLNKRMNKVRNSTLDGKEKYNQLKNLTVKRNMVAKKVEQIKNKIKGYN